jgi:hypothetical protein
MTGADRDGYVGSQTSSGRPLIPDRLGGHRQLLLRRMRDGAMTALVSWGIDDDISEAIRKDLYDAIGHILDRRLNVTHELPTDREAP